MNFRNRKKSDLFDSCSSMAPNSEESCRLGTFQYMEETLTKDRQRPPIYNPEDYAASLKKWGKKSSGGMVANLYMINNGVQVESEKGLRAKSNSFRDYRNPMLISSGCEMTLRQFGTVTELLTKLKSDLRLAYPNFVQEFVSDPLDGITLLLDLLRAIQLSQSTNPQASPGSSHTTGKISPAIQRRALLDELACLQCLLTCCTRYPEASRRLTASSAGLFTLAICIMSNVNKSRILALELLTKTCEPPGNGHSAVSEAMSTLRLRFGEPVRFRFLVGMLTSTGGQVELLAAGMKFLNKFLDTSSSLQKRLYIQAELDQAGFDVDIIRKNISVNSNIADKILEEINHWDTHNIDVQTLMIRANNAERENDRLRDKVLLLERKVQILQEEKGILISLEQCLKDRCGELQDEVLSLKSNKSETRKYRDKSGKTDDEGISSSERSSSPEDTQKYHLYNIEKKTSKEATSAIEKAPCDEEETTIEEVMEELNNIINDVESENYKNEQQIRKKIEEAQVAGKLKMRMHPAADDNSLEHEVEIIPSKLNPQPPRRAKSLIHLFVPVEDYEYGNKEMFFENETAYNTSDDGSDSLLSASKCQGNPQSGPPTKRTTKSPLKRRGSKTNIKRSESFRHLPKFHLGENGRLDDFRSSAAAPQYIQKQNVLTELAQRIKSKSLDRIGDGLDSMVDIVVTENPQQRTKSDSGNVSATTLSRSVSNMFFGTNKVSAHSEEKQRMFLPCPKDQYEVPYYFPRVQEKRASSNSSFLIKRGHANAGMYSGHILKDSNLVTVYTNKEYISTGSNCRLAGKVTDIPSGLY